MTQINDYLELMVKDQASDLYLITGAPPTLKIEGNHTPINNQMLTSDLLNEFVNGILSEQQKSDFDKTHEMNFALSFRGVGRFRVNVFKQRGDAAIVIRNIKTTIPDFESINLPAILTELVMKQRGLILFVGATGTGKSTSLASIINYRNQNSPGHIITVEDPIEYVYRHHRSIVTQREIGMDTDSYTVALKNTLRQAPDVILIGEIRDHGTMKHAIAFSETGHLCLATLHANNSNQALERIMYFFPEDNRDQLLLELSLNVIAIISQRLVHGIDGRLVPAFEILLGTPLVKELIKRNDISGLKEAMSKSENLGMITFDRSLLKLYEQGKITGDEALRHADSHNDLRLAINHRDRINQADGDDFSIVQPDKDDKQRYC